MDEYSVACEEGSSSPAHIQIQDLISPQSISFETQPVIEPSIFEPNAELDMLRGLDTDLDAGSTCSFSTKGVINISSEKRSVTEGIFKINELVSCINASDKSNTFRVSDSNEAALLMHYLDHAFYTQFPFYSTSTFSRGRGWLFTLLTGDQAIYYATLAFSQYHRDSNSPAKRSSLIENAQPSEMIDYYVFALNKLQLRLGEVHMWSGSEGVLRSMKALTCILQFIFLEVHSNGMITPSRYEPELILTQVFSNSFGNWSVHLKAADALLLSLVEVRIRYSQPGPREFRGQELQDICCLSPEDHLAVELILGAFLWLDILAQVSTRAKLSSQFNPELVLEKGNIDLQYLFGCKNWVVLLILKISKLDYWKQECEKNRKLSVAELARQGSKIEADLNQGLAGISTQNPSQGRNSSKFAPEDKFSAITTCFGLAALTYLHVVVSGAHPDLPEIDDSVSRGMDVLRTLRDWKLLKAVAWPVCVIGCMVSESKQCIFQSFVNGDDVADLVGTFPRAIEIIEHCWKEREAGLGNFDWFSAMKGVGQHILLL